MLRAEFPRKRAGKIYILGSIESVTTSCNIASFRKCCRANNYYCAKVHCVRSFALIFENWSDDSGRLEERVVVR